MMLIKEATRSYGLDKVGIVGTPCQMQAIRKAQLYPMAMRKVPDKIALAIGIFCMENFPYQGLETIVEDHCNVKMESAVKMDIGKGKFSVYTERGALSQIPLGATHKYEQPGCHVCPDGWSTVFVRTKKGEDVWSKAVAAGYFETKDIASVKPGLDLVTKLATGKIDKNQKTLEGRASFGVGKGLRNPYI